MKNHRGGITILLALLIWAASVSGSMAADFEALVTWVYDGDTIQVRAGGSKVRIRVFGIDSPEQGQPYARDALKHCIRLAKNKVVLVRPIEKDRYNRLVASVTLPCGADLAEEMVKAGLAWHYKRYSDDQELDRLEIRARDEKRGLWRQNNPEPPWVYKIRTR